jgi:hypothetical protein
MRHLYIDVIHTKSSTSSNLCSLETFQVADGQPVIQCPYLVFRVSFFVQLRLTSAGNVYAIISTHVNQRVPPRHASGRTMLHSSHSSTASLTAFTLSS